MQLLLGLLLFVPLFIWDRRTTGKIHSATKFGFAMMALWEISTLSVFWFNLPWAKVATHLPGLGA